MEERPFLDKVAEPTDVTLRQALGDLYIYYGCLMDITHSFFQDWNFSKTSGWILKVYQKNKALFYLIPLKNEFKISLAIRDNERDAFLDDDELKMFHERISSAKKYREGYALLFQVNGDDEYKNLEIFIKKLIPLR